MDKGWVKMNRSLLDWEWYTDNNVKILFLHLILRANIVNKKWRGQLIKKGSLITGRIQLSNETGLSEQNVRTAIKKLQLTNELTIEKTFVGSVFTLVNWNKYQTSNHENNQLPTKDQPMTNQRLTKDQPMTNQRLTTTKEDKKYKEYKEEEEKRLTNDDLILKCLQDEIWLEAICMQNKTTIEKVKEHLVNDFKNQLVIDSKNHKDLIELKKHFGNWIRTKTSIEQKNKTESQSSSNTFINSNGFEVLRGVI